MAKIHIDCEDAILACEKVIEFEEVIYNKYCDVLERLLPQDSVMSYPEGTGFYRETHEKRRLVYIKIAAIKNLMHGASYSKYKSRRLILDTQSEEFGLISKYLPTE